MPSRDPAYSCLILPPASLVGSKASVCEEQGFTWL